MKRLAPQAGLEPATLRLTGGIRNVSRPLPLVAPNRRIARFIWQESALFHFRLVSDFAAHC
jgi:hypothetical protein